MFTLLSLAVIMFVSDIYIIFKRLNYIDNITMSKLLALFKHWLILCILSLLCFIFHILFIVLMLTKMVIAPVFWMISNS